MLCNWIEATTPFYFPIWKMKGQKISKAFDTFQKQQMEDFGEE